MLRLPHLSQTQTATSGRKNMEKKDKYQELKRAGADEVIPVGRKLEEQLKQIPARGTGVCLFIY